MLRIAQIKLSINEPESVLRERILDILHIKEADLLSYTIFKQSIDARRRGQLFFVYTVDVLVENESRLLAKQLPNISEAPVVNYEYPSSGEATLKTRPIVVGFGPAGMFAALILAERGYRPLVLERGGAVDERVEAIENFWENGVLNTESNVQFGVGGAGTFSDGKLTTRVKDLRGRKVLEALVEGGGPSEILYTAHPHIGTDVLRGVVKNIREKIISLGGEVRFNTRVNEFMIEAGQMRGVKVSGGEVIESEHVIVAIGHSARDTFYALHEKGVDMSAKPFAVGVRIEHPQTLIDKAQYKEFAGHKRLGAAEYRLTHTASNGRGVYTFCMCPGGVVVPSSSEKGRLVTNGMSYHARDEVNANSAVLVQVGVQDFGSDHPLAGVEFQRRLEEKAFGMGGSAYVAPAQLVGDFLNRRASKTLGSVTPSYAIGVKLTNLHKLLPTDIADAMVEGIQAFDRKLRGFAMHDAVMTGVESRSSSPVRLDRHPEELHSINVKGLYPSGEGAGFAGGIVSAGIDGIKCAEIIIKNYQPLN